MFGTKSAGIRFGALIGLSVVFIVLLQLVHLPAALLLGSIAAGIVMAALNGAVRIPPTISILAQAFVGCLMARAIPASVIGEIVKDGPLFVAGVVSVIFSSAMLGWILTRLRVMPGTTAIWGSAPGAATAMTLLAEAFGADVRLVAFMQYLRVVCVAVVASIVARIGTSETGVVPAMEWFPAIAWWPFAQTLALAAVGAFVAPRLKIPAGPMLVPLALGSILQDVGWMSIELPPWLLALCYAAVGWNIGLRFTGPILGYAVRVLPKVLLSIFSLIALCGIFAALLVRFAGIDPLTAYLATSPGGADSVAIIAASSNVDVPFVMAMQTARFIVVLLTGPSLARFIARLTGVSDTSAAPTAKP